MTLLLLACLIHATTAHAALPRDLQLADLILARQAQKHLSWGTAAALNQARGEWLELMKLYPLSPQTHKVPEYLALIDLALAKIAGNKKDFRQARSLIERALTRLSTESKDEAQLGLLRPQDIQLYAKICAPKPDEICTAWLRRIAGFSPKISPEFEALSDFKTKPWLDRLPVESFSRASQAYHAPDLDAQAYDDAVALLVNHQARNADAAFTHFLELYPKSSMRYRVLYWQARAQIELGAPQKSQPLYVQILKEAPLSWPGLLASFELNRSVNSQISAVIPSTTDHDANLQPVEINRLARAKKLIHAHERDFAADELKEIRPRDALSSSFLFHIAQLQTDVGAHSAAFVILSELIQRGYDGVQSTQGVRMIFPTEYWEKIQKISAPNSIDPVLVLSLVKQESAFDPQALSTSHAHGLMQLLYSTALESNPEHLPLDRTVLGDSDLNLKIGTHYLKQLLDHFKSNVPFALAAYNAGPNAVSRWIRDGKANQGLELFIEQIPFKETRDYVASILRNYFWYSWILGRDISAQTLANFWKAPQPTR